MFLLLLIAEVANTATSEPAWIAVATSLSTALVVAVDKWNYHRHKKRGTNISGQIAAMQKQIDNAIRRNDDDHEKVMQLISTLNGTVSELRGYIKGKLNGGGL